MNQKSIIHFYMLNCNRVFGTDRHWLLLSPSFHSSNMFDMFGQAHVSGWIGTLRHFLLHNETCLFAVCYIDKYRWVWILIYQNTFRWTNSKTFAWFNTLILEANVRSFWLFTCWLWDDSMVSKLNTCHKGHLPTIVDPFGWRHASAVDLLSCPRELEPSCDFVD